MVIDPLPGIRSGGQCGRGSIYAHVPPCQNADAALTLFPLPRRRRVQSDRSLTAEKFFLSLRWLPYVLFFLSIRLKTSENSINRESVSEK